MRRAATRRRPPDARPRSGNSPVSSWGKACDTGRRKGVQSGAFASSTARAQTAASSSVTPLSRSPVRTPKEISAKS
jgi:hypothetical protein